MNRFDIHNPSERLRPYVKHFVISESDEVHTYKVLPGTSLVMGFQYSGKLSYLDGSVKQPLAQAGITGLMDAYRIFNNTANTGSVLVIFNETGAAHFFANPVNELFRQSLSLEHLFRRDALDATAEKLSMAATDKQKIAIVENILISHLTERPADLMVGMALQYIHHAKGNIRIGELAEKLNTSQSPLEKRFRAIVGSSPKKFASIVRVKNVLTALETNKEDGLIHLEAGYYDQAHFIKEFKSFTATTPEQYLKDLQ